MTDHDEVRFGALWTDHAAANTPLARAKRYLHKVRSMTDEEFHEQKESLNAEWQELKPLLTPDQIYTLFQET